MVDARGISWNTAKMCIRDSGNGIGLLLGEHAAFDHPLEHHLHPLEGIQRDREIFPDHNAVRDLFLL